MTGRGGRALRIENLDPAVQFRLLLRFQICAIEFPDICSLLNNSKKRCALRAASRLSYLSSPPGGTHLAILDRASEAKT
jgi:hypothetical protein